MEMFLFGAGASHAAGVPVANEMSANILSKFPKESAGYRVLSFVIGGLLFRQGERGENPLSGQINVEDLFNAVQLLAQRNNLEAAPFVGSWHHGVAELDKRIEISKNEAISRILFQAIWKEISATIPRGGDIDDNRVNNSLLNLVKAVVGKYSSYTTGGYGSVGRSISDHIEKYLKNWADNLKQRSSQNYALDRALDNAIQSSKDVAGEGEIFSDTARKMIVLLRELVWITQPERVAYLRPLVCLLSDQPRLAIATLNYDNSIELMAQEAGIACRTGIDQWNDIGNTDCAGDGLILLKLHGSIDWRFEDFSGERGKQISGQTVKQVSPSDVLKNNDPAVIFGQRNKLRADGPFLSLLRNFGVELARSKRLTIVGYSFADEHVNEYISRWFNSDVDRKIRIVAPSFATNSQPFAKLLRRYAGERLEIIDARAEEAFENICKPRQMVI